MQVRVLPSQGKNRLYIGNLPKQLSQDEVEAILKPLTKGAPPAPDLRDCPACVGGRVSPACAITGPPRV